MSKKRKNRKKFIILTLITAVLLSGVGLAFTLQADNSKTSKTNTESEFIASKGSLEKRIETTGEIVPNLEVQIKCKASGEITELPLDISDSVKTGDILLQLDPEDEETSVKQAEVSLAVSQAEYEQAKVNLDLSKQKLAVETIRAESALKLAEAKKYEFKAKFERAQTLHEKNVTSDETYEAAHTAFVDAYETVSNAEADIKDLESLKMDIEIKEHNVKIAEAKVESSQLSLKDAQQRLSDVTVTAPIDGVVSNQDVQVGQIIASGVNNVDGGTTIMTIADLSKIFVLAAVDESDIGEVEEGQNAIISVDAYPDLKFSGKIERIATTGRTVSSVVTFEVKIEINGKNRELLKPGMTADIEIIALEKSDVIAVPATAVTRKLKEQYVTIKDEEGNNIDRLVTVGDNDGEKIEIVEGINVGDVVVITNNTTSKWTNTSGEKRMGPGGTGGAMGGMRI